MADDRVYFGDDFGQKIDLTVRIREILRNYPEGTSIFKEMVQNADDAEATEIAFCLDLRQHISEGLAYEKMGKFQGPSLAVYNNATFTDADFQSIQRIGDSLKKDGSKGWKTGRFGVGFNSVYHLTDLPAFVSGPHLVFFDPQACHLPNVNPSNPGKIIDFVTHPQLVRDYPNQVEPFRLFGCDFSGPFNGTVFRLALRSKEQASTSRISSRAQTPDHMLEMLEEFAESADLVLLFLRNVTNIKIFKWNEGSEQPDLLHEASIANMSDQTRAKRSLASSMVVSNTTSHRHFDRNGHVCDYQIDVAVFNADCASKLVRFFVFNQLGGGECSEMANDPANAAQRLVPWGGVALRLPSDSMPYAAEQGLAFCFLPLPTHTYLPVHVNGYFELSSNRRDIWFGEGLSGEGLLRANWNKALLEDVIAPCYARALLRMTDQSFMEPQEHAKLFPREIPPEPWDALSQSVLKIVRGQPCLFSEARGGVWVAPTEALIVKRSTEDYEDLVRDLLEDDIPVVTTLTEEIERVLVKSAAVAGYMLPKTLRSHYAGQISKHTGNRDAIKRTLAFLTRDLDEFSLEELNGVNLLPLCDNSLATFRKPIEGETAAQLDQLSSMGFSRAQSLFALQSTGGRSVEVALNWLIAHPSLPPDAIDHVTLKVTSYFIPNSDERAIFERATGRLVDNEALPTRLQNMLSSERGSRSLNVQNIDTEGLEELLLAIFPREWYGKSRVAWKADEEMYLAFSEAWVRRFWHYIGPSSRLRSLQDKWPILPTESGFLCSLNAASGVVSPELLPTTCIAALTKIGMPLLLKNLFATVQPHTDIWNYIHQPTPGGLLSSFANSCSRSENEIKSSWSTVTSHEREHLREFLLADACQDLDKAQKLALSKIPIFRGLVRSECVDPSDVMWTDVPIDENLRCGFSPVFVGLHGNGVNGLRVMCPGMKWFFLNEQFVSVKEDDRSTIDSLTRLSVRSITKSEYFAKFIIPRLDEMPVGLRIEFIRYLLRELNVWMAEDQSGDLSRLIETVPMFPAVNGELKRIGDLFDPDIDEFNKIMDDSFYPAVELQEAQPLSVLRSLGLQRYLSRKSVLALALSLEAEQAKILADDDATESLSEWAEALKERAIEVFRYLDAHMEQLTTVSTSERKTKKKNFKAKGMSLIRFPFAGQNARLNNEREDARLREEAEEQLALETSEIEDFIAKLEVIAWAPVSHHLDLPIPIHEQDERVIVAPPKNVRPPKDQILCSSQYHILSQPVRSDALREQFQWSVPIAVEIVAKQLKAVALARQAKVDQETPDEGEWTVVYEIYKRLSRFFEAESDKEKRETVLSVFNGDFDFIWAGGHFVSPDRVALTMRVNAEPYLFGVSSEMLHFRPFLKAVGVRESFSANDYVAVLAMMYKKLQGQQQACNGAEGVHLTETELMAAIGLVQLISDVLSHHTNYELFVPDANGMMSRSVDLCIYDAPWLHKGNIDLDAIRFIHPKISNEVGTKLGAKSLRSILVHANQDGTLFSSSDGDMEAFGQTEALTKRISHILEQYPDGSHIISELIQNADDAGASRVCIMYSEVTFGSSSLLSPAMAKWQGPALYVYNDAEFQDSDFINLARLGQGGKLQRVSTTGRFGLGFNSVYHFTDVPSVISANSLVIFDPHATHLPVTPANPGIRVRFVNSSLPEQFPDQFEPFKVFGCDVASHFHGSVFRFPLRHEGLASASEIKQRAYGREDILNLFESFRKTSAETMLFLRNVRKVEVMIQTSPDVPPFELYSAEVPEGERGDAWRQIDRFIRGDNDGAKSDAAPVSKASFYTRLARTPEADLPSISQTLHIHTRERTDVGDWLRHANRATLDLPTSGDAWTTKTEEYLVHNQVGGGRARAMACAQEHESLKLIPWVGIAGRLQEPVVDGRAFCFLPLPVKTTLPVHVNGYFELSSNRRDIWHGDDLSGDGKLRSEWNASLLEDAIASAYVNFLLEAKHRCGRRESMAYMSLFPVKIPAGPWGDLVTAMYQIAKEKPVLTTSSSALRSSGEPISPSSCVPVDESVEGWEVLEKALNTVSISTVRIPAAVREIMGSVEAIRGKFTPSFFRRLVRSARFLPSLDRQEATRVIEFCLVDVRDPTARAELNQTPLVPALDGTFKPLIIFESGHRSPSDVDLALFFANDIESALLTGLHDHLVNYEYKSLFEGLNGRSNLFRLTPQHVCKGFLPKILPSEWSQRVQIRCLWDPVADVRHPSCTWLREWWNYVEHALDDIASDQDMNAVEEAIRCWPLTPVVHVDGQASQVIINAGKTSIPAVIQTPQSILPAELIVTMPPILHKLGVATVDPSYVAGGRTQTWMLEKRLIFNLDLNGFLSALANGLLDGDKQDLQNSFAILNASERKALEDFVTSQDIDHLDRENLVLLRKLPIFRVHADLGGLESFRSLNDTVLLAGENADLRVLGPQFFVAPPKSSIRRFLQSVEVEEWSSTRVLLEHVLPRLGDLLVQAGPELVNSVVQTALLELPFHQRQEPAFRDTVKGLPIILSEKMELHQISDLYDPRERDLSAFVGPNSLPHKDFAGEDMISILRSLGLRHSLSCHAIVQSAKSIEAMVNEGVTSADTERRAKSLLSVVNRSFDDLVENMRDGASEAKETSSRAIEDAVLTLRRTKWLPIHAAPFKPLLPWPKDFDPRRKFASADTTRPESDAWKCSSNRDILAGNIKSEVLINGFGWDIPVDLVTVAAQLVALGDSVQSSERGDVSSADFKVVVHETQQLYQILDDASSAGDPDEISSLCEMLRPAAWVWTGSRFASIQQVALNADSDLEPLLFAAPPDVLVPRSLLTLCGLKQDFEVMDYVLALRSLSSNRGVLPEDERVTCTKLLERIAGLMSAENAPSSFASDAVLLLDETGCLTPAHKLVYDDMEWNESSEVRRGYRFVNRCLSRDVALRLGAVSLHSRLAETSMSSTRLKCPPVDSLKKIIPSRDQWFDVFFREVLLAAERIGGSQVDFFVDYRKHPSQRVIQPSFQLLQEEAICVHIHDVVLSTQAVTGLYGGEMSRPGLLTGFTFSDCLQVLTGDGFYVLDPTNKVLSAPTSESTRAQGSARRYDILGEDFLRYPDQLIPFSTLPTLSGNVSGGTRSTLLRFPLRKEESTLSSYVLSLKTMERFIKFVQVQLVDCIVFTESVHRAAVWSVGKESEFATERRGQVSLESGVETLRRRNSTRHNTDWKKKFSFQSFFKAPVTPENQLEFGIDLEIDNKCFKDTWLLSDNIGAGRSRDLAGSAVHEVLNSTPYVSVACHLLRDGKPARPVRGKLFKIVKIAQDVRLPVHINGCFKKPLSDSSVHFNTPRSGQNDEQAIAAHWNRVLLEDGVVKAYSRLLHHAKRVYGQSSSPAFYRLWPVKVEATNVVASQIQHQLFRKLQTQDVFLCSDGSYRPLREGYVVDTTGMDLQVVSFAQLHFPSFAVPTTVLDDAKRLFPSLVYSLAPRTMRRYLRNMRASEMHASLSLSLLEYCLSDLVFPLPPESDPVWGEFNGLPLLPLEDGSVGNLGVSRRGRYVLASFNQVQLLPSLSNMFVSLEARQRLQPFFSDARFITQMGLGQFSIKTLSDNIGSVLPAPWRDQPVVEWLPDSEGHPSQAWMHRFWSEVRYEPRSLGYFSAWPLIPVQDSRLVSCGRPNAAICVWDGAFDRGLREDVCRVVRETTLLNEQRLASLEVERAKLRELPLQELADAEMQDSYEPFPGEDEDMLLRGDPDTDEESVEDARENAISGIDSTVAEMRTDGAETQEPASEALVASESSDVDGAEPEPQVAEIDSSTDARNAAVVHAAEGHDVALVAGSIVDEDSDASSRPALHDLLHRLHVPLIELAYLAGQEMEIIPSARGVAVSVLEAVCASDRTNGTWRDISAEDATQLAVYFSDHSQRHGCFTRMHLEMLKNLPIYVNISGEACALNQGDNFLVPLEINLAAIPLPAEARQRFMRPNPQLTSFYRDLGVEDMGYAKLLVFLLPFHSQLSHDQQASVLALIKEKWSLLRGDSSVISVLRSTPLFASDDGSFRCADAFFDPRNSVFSTLFANTRGNFPCEPMKSSDTWLDLMADIGLRSEITVELFVECARRLEAVYAEKTSLTVEDERVVNSLHDFFLQNFDKYDRSRVFFEQVLSIRFVPAVIHENSLAGRGGSSTPSSRTVLTTYSNCAIPEDQALVFSCIPIISTQALPPRVLWSRLGLQSPPPKPSVLRNLLHIVETAGESISESWLFFVPIVDSFQAIFKYLQDEWDRLTPEERAQLANTPLVPVGSSLVKGSRLFFHLAENLAPVMFEVPRAFGAYDTLFRRLGSKDSPAVEDYIDVLRDLAKECGGSQLNLNELLSVSRIVSLLADEMTEQNKALGADAKQQLYLPSTQSVMCQVIQMAYNDDPWICTRVDLTELQVVHPRVTLARCNVLGVKGISQVVSEQLDGQEFLDVPSMQTPEIRHMNTVVASQQFGNGLRTLISVQHQKATSSTLADFDELHHRIVSLGSYHIRAVATLRTRFLAQLGHPPRVVDVTKASTATASISFVDAESKIVYIATNTLRANPGVRVAQVVAGRINQLLGGSVHDCSAIESMLTIDVLEIEPLLKLLNIQDDPTLIAEKLRGAYGELLCERDRELAELAPLRSFYVGEVVAVEHSGGLRYAKIMNEEGSANGISRYEVRVHQAETSWYPATQIFSFKSFRGSSRSQSATRHERNAAFVERLAEARASSSAAARTASVDLPPSVIARDFTAPGATSHSSSSVAPVTVVAAVNDLLGRMNLSLDSTYAGLLAENLRLQRRLEQAEEGRRLATAQVETALREKKDAEETLVCMVCLESKVDRVLIPCGHIYCSGCVAQLPRPTCPVCRQTIASTSQFHVPS